MAKILQLRISLNEIKPEIWRTFLVEDSITFKKLHEIIQIVMGWEDYHLYEFWIDHEKITPEEEGFNLAEASFRDLHSSPEFAEFVEKQDMSKGSISLDSDKINEIMQNIKKNKQKNKFDVKTKISQLLSSRDQKFFYIYDFGDSWKHSVIIEKITDKDDSVKYPVCVSGERACPPEDCGGISGYYNLMKIKKNKKHPEYKQLIVEWLGEDYDPDLFFVDWINARLRGKKPAGVWMAKDRDEKIEEDEDYEFVLLGDILKKDNETVLQMKTIFNREPEYVSFLGGIEFTIAIYFLENRNLKDKDVENAVKNIKKNYLQNIDFFKTELDKKLIMGLSFLIQEKSITPHELKLILDYVLWSIDNRSWIPDNQAFVKWLPYFFKLYDKNEMKKYELNLKKICKRMGLSQNEINNLLNIENTEISEEQKGMTELESELFSLKEDEKLGFVIKNAMKNPSIFQIYVMELDKKQNYAAIEKLCKKIIEVNGEHPPIEFLMGLNYLNMKNPILAKHHMENAMKKIESLPSDFFLSGERENMVKDMKKEIKRLI